MYIQLDEVREVQIQSCFKCNVEFHYPSSTLEFEDVLEISKFDPEPVVKLPLIILLLMMIITKKM